MVDSQPWIEGKGGWDARGGLTRDFSVADVLSKAKPGDERSVAELLPLVYAELKVIAARELERGAGGGGYGRSGHTLQPTALVHEAFLKLVGNDKKWSGRDHFMAVASKAMRQVLVDHARRKNADKRGGGKRVDVNIEAMGTDDGGVSGPVAGAVEIGGVGGVRVVELDALLTELAASSERAARVAEMHLFGGMDQEQIARVLDVSRMTVNRDWAVARAWLAAKMRDTRDE